MNKQGPGKIGWTGFTWNPISGCLHGCSYCYMRRMDHRFPGMMKPAFHPERLSQPAKVKKPSLVFTGSSGDMWGKWVRSVDISAVLEICDLVAPYHTYQFLTKNPDRYLAWDLPYINCWAGTTVDGTGRTLKNLDIIKLVDVGTRFISFEPLLKPVKPDLTGINWVIIGADSTRGAARPPKEWADIIIDEARLRSIPVFVKDNYGYPERIKEVPVR